MNDSQQNAKFINYLDRFFLVLKLRETFFKKDAVEFLSPLISPLFPNIFIFFETWTQYKVPGKKSKKSDNFKGVYETTKNRLFWA